MLTKTTLAQNSTIKVGWILLIVLAALMTLNHLTLLFILDEPVLFTGFAAFNLYALLVILIPFRLSEKWAWFTTWILPFGLALPASTNSDIAIYYYGVAAVCVVGLLLTLRGFFPEG
jgi:hypothetical protein